MEFKKKRGCNYTLAEKATLLELIGKYKTVLENKETNGPMILKKRQAWNEVTRRYNAHNTSGIRTWQQLRHLYENIKQRSKKNFVEDQATTQLSEQEKFNFLIKKTINDMKEITQTNDSAYQNVLIETDPQIVAMVAPQPFENSGNHEHHTSYDAASYFGEAETFTHIQDIDDDPNGNNDDLESGNMNSFDDSNPSTSTDCPESPNIESSEPNQASTKQLRKLWVNLKHRQKHTSSTPSAHSMPLNSNSDISISRLRHSILEKEYNDGQRRANELHDLELMLLNEKIREAKAKADLAELLISRERSSETMFLKREDVDE